MCGPLRGYERLSPRLSVVMPRGRAQAGDELKRLSQGLGLMKVLRFGSKEVLALREEVYSLVGVR